jgi:hypothetical protein
MHANSVLCIFTIKGKGRLSRRNREDELVAEPLAKTVSPAPSVARVTFMRASGSNMTFESRSHSGWMKAKVFKCHEKFDPSAKIQWFETFDSNH